MTTLYRTPNIVIDAHEWHAIVRQQYGRCCISYFWRPLSGKPVRWGSISAWQGPKPKRMWKFFEKYRPHMAIALASEQARAAALAGMKRTVHQMTIEKQRGDFLAA